MQCPAIYDKVEEVMKKIPGIKVLPRIHTPSGSEDCALFIRRVIERGGSSLDLFSMVATITGIIVRILRYRTNKVCPSLFLYIQGLPNL